MTGWKGGVGQTAIVYAELQLAYDTFNAELFDNSLAGSVALANVDGPIR